MKEKLLWKKDCTTM